MCGNYRAWENRLCFFYQGVGSFIALLHFMSSFTFIPETKSVHIADVRAQSRNRPLAEVRQHEHVGLGAEGESSRYLGSGVPVLHTSRHV